MSKSLSQFIVQNVTSLGALNSKRAKKTKLRGQSFPEYRYNRLKELGLCACCGKEKEDNKTIHCNKCRNSKNKNKRGTK